MRTKNVIKCFAVIIALFMTTNVTAQSKEDLKSAKKEAKTFAKEGWKVNAGYLSLEEQIANSKPILREQENWVVGEARSTGSFYDAARANALMAAKVNLAKVVESQIAGDGELLTGNQQEGKGNAVSAGKYKEVARTRFVSNITRPKMLMDCYRDLKNGNVEVQIRIAIPWDQAKLDYEKLMSELEEMAKKQ